MKRRSFFVFLAVFLIPGPAFAQNNAYGIDDECYQYFLQAEAAVGTDNYEAAAEKLLASALERQDEKARTLYYVDNLKHVVKLQTDAGAKGLGKVYEQQRAQIESRAMACFEQLKAVSRETGYMQYYYYAYSQIRNFYYYTQQYGKMLEVLLEMRNTALAEKDEYGQWIGDKYLANMYMSQNDFSSARKYLKEVIEVYERSDDPTIRRQMIAESFLDIAECYPIGSDSMRLFIGKAAANPMGMVDSVRCRMNQAVLALMDRRPEEYAAMRDRTLRSNYATKVSVTIHPFFQYAEAMVDGTIEKYQDQLQSLQTYREFNLLSSLAESFGRYKTAFELERMKSSRLERKISLLNEMNLSEVEARYGNNLLNANLAEKTAQVQHISRVAMVLAALIMLGLLCFLLLHIRTLRRARKKDEQRIAELTEANERARLADEAKTRFIQNMRHEIRTPLNAITGFSQLLSLPDGMFSPEEKEEFSGHIINNTKMLTMLLDDILHSTDNDSGGYTVTLEDAECESICRLALSSAEHRLQPGVELVFRPGMELPYGIKTDPLRVQQVLTNLLTNACKHTSSGQIRLGCSLEEVPGMLAFSVEDTGPGIPADQAERIFERFVKLDEFKQGTGLGLSICRDIAARMNGRVYLDTTYTGGARFVFAIPAGEN